MQRGEEVACDLTIADVVAVAIDEDDFYSVVEQIGEIVKAAIKHAIAHCPEGLQNWARTFSIVQLGRPLPFARVPGSGIPR